MPTNFNPPCYAAKLSQPNTVQVTLFHYRFKVFLFWAEKSMRLCNTETFSDLLNNENQTSINYSLFRNLKYEKIRCNENNFANFEVLYIFQGDFSVRIKRTVGSRKASHIATNSSLQNFLNHFDISHTTTSSQQRHPSNCSNTTFNHSERGPQALPPSPRSRSPYWHNCSSQGSHCPPPPQERRPYCPQ